MARSGRIMESLAQTYGDTAGEQRYGTMAARAHASFNGLFWNEAAGCLYDVVSSTERDGTIRQWRRRFAERAKSSSHDVDMKIFEYLGS